MIPLPKALFDQPHYLARGNPLWLSDYASDLGIPELVDEYVLVSKFLLMYEGSEDTFNSYRRECERLCQWTWLVNQTPIKCIDRHALAQYFHFIQNPPKHWVSFSYADRFRYDEYHNRVPCEQWRPFLQRRSLKHEQQSYEQKGLSLSSIRAAMAGVSTFLTFLQQEGYITQNPALLLRQKSRFLQREQSSRVVRKLSGLQWNTLIDGIKSIANHQAQYERHLFMFASFYLLGLRISEMSSSSDREAIMGDFRKDSQRRWWFSTIGKGNKRREVAVPDTMLEYLQRYRKSLGLSPTPTIGELTPLLPKIKGRGGLGVRQIRKIVQEGFDMAINQLIQQGLTEEAVNMKSATVHWLRHTAISHDVMHRPREHVRDDAGHQSVSVTDRYIDIELDARHASAKTKSINVDYEYDQD